MEKIKLKVQETLETTVEIVLDQPLSEINSYDELFCSLYEIPSSVLQGAFKNTLWRSKGVEYTLLKSDKEVYQENLDKFKSLVSDTLDIVLKEKPDRDLQVIENFELYNDCINAQFCLNRVYMPDLDDPTCAMKWAYNFEHISNMKKLFMYKHPKNVSQEMLGILVSKLITLIGQQRTILENLRIY